MTGVPIKAAGAGAISASACCFFAIRDVCGAKMLRTGRLLIRFRLLVFTFHSKTVWNRYSKNP
jgi:hypothetical protein